MQHLKIQQQVLIGYLETSNINVVSEMVDMINIAREFESNQKIVNSIDEMLGKMVSISEL